MSQMGHGETNSVRAFLVRSIFDNGRLAAPQYPPASCPLSPVATRHSLPSGRYSLTWAGLSSAGSHQLCLAVAFQDAIDVARCALNRVPSRPLAHGAAQGSSFGPTSDIIPPFGCDLFDVACSALDLLHVTCLASTWESP